MILSPQKVIYTLSVITSLYFSNVLKSQINSESELNQKYWNMRERFRKYFITIGADEGQSIPVATKQSNMVSGGGRCSAIFSDSEGFMYWSEGTGYLSDYICTLSTEYALLTMEGKSTKATLNELYYALNAIDRLDGFAEKAFGGAPSADYNGFFLRDDVKQLTASYWNDEYSNTDSLDKKLNYKCIDASHMNNLDGSATGNSPTNEPSLDQIVTIFQGFSFIKKYVPNVYVKPTASDVGFNIIDKMQDITARIMDYMSGADRDLLLADQASEKLYNAISHPTPLIFGAGNPIMLASSLLIGNTIDNLDCGDNNVRGNWILMNPITGRKVGTGSSATDK